MPSPTTYADAEIPLPRLRTISQLWSCAAVLAALGVAALAVDVPLARWIAAGQCPGMIEKICNLGELFGHGIGIGVIVALITVLDPWHRYAIPRILAASLGSGMLANGFKLILGRTRPLHYDLQGRGLDTFSGWFPLLEGGSWQQSFPSSHAATAAGLAIVLACFYPRGRWLFPLLAGVAGCQRVVEQYHFLSDVFWGAAVGCIFAPLCIYGSRLAQTFDRLEDWLIGRSGRTATTRVPQRCAIHGAPAAQTTDAAAILRRAA